MTCSHGFAASKKEDPPISKKQAPSVRLLNELMRTRDFQALLDLARPTFGNPMILSNGSYSVIAITDEPDIHDPRWLEIVQTRGIPLGVITFGGINEAYRCSLDTCRPVLDTSDSTAVPMLRKALAVGDHILGYLDSPLYCGAAEDSDIEFFDFVGNLIALELQKDQGRTSLPDNMLDYFVYDLLEGHLTDQQFIQARLNFFHWDLLAQGKVQIVSIQGRDRDLEPDHTRFRRLLDLFASAFPLYKTFVYVDQLKMLCPVEESLQMDRGFCQILEGLLSQEGLVAGVSRPLLRLDTISDFNRQAQQAAELGRRLHPEKAVHFYDNYAIYHALELAAPQEDLFQFCHSAVALLRDYDYIHETELLESLRVYLTHNRSIGESAAALYIHRNTMNYRIARINELTQLDLGDPDVFCHLLFSFYALDYRLLLSRDEPESLVRPELRQDRPEPDA
mgnify:FL=1